MANIEDSLRKELKAMIDAEKPRGAGSHSGSSNKGGSHANGAPTHVKRYDVQAQKQAAAAKRAGITGNSFVPPAKPQGFRSHQQPPASRPPSGERKPFGKPFGKPFPPKAHPGAATKPQAAANSSNAAPAAPEPSMQVDTAKLDDAQMSGRLGVGAGNWFDLVPQPAAPAPAPAAAEKDADGQQQAGKKRKREPMQPTPIEPAVIQRLRASAEKLLSTEVSAYESRKGASMSADDKWMRTVISSGTSSDKLAAMTLLVQQSPLHNLRHLDGLLHLAAKKSRREAQQAVDALRDLFLHNLLPSNRKLRSFVTTVTLHLNALQASGENKKGGFSLKPEVLVWALLEDNLRGKYADFVKLLEAHTADGLTYFKTGAMRTVMQLLAEKPEQESFLLGILVNKLGDPEGSIASKAAYQLSQLVNQHEAMKAIIVREVRQFVYRPHNSQQAQYYATTFLNQIPLRRHETQIAVELIQTYFSLFETVVKRDELGSRLLSALLTGVNRAFPFTNDANAQKEVESHADSVFTVVHKSTLNTAVQALMLLTQMAQRRIEAGDESSTAQSAAATAEAAADADKDDAGEGEPVHQRGSFIDRYYRALYSRLDYASLSGTNKYALVLNLVFRALRMDPSVGRARACLKRLVHTATALPPHFAAGVVFLVAELMRVRGDLRAAVSETESGTPSAAAAAKPATEEQKAAALANLDAALSAPKHSEKSDTAKADAAAAPGQRAAPTQYDPSKREPKYAGADRACLWEIAPLAAHFHPSVRAFADAVMSDPGTALAYSGDPLADFTLMAFLDRVVFKQPKAKVLSAFGKDGEGASGSKGDKVDLEDELQMGYAMVQGKDVEAMKATKSGLLHGHSHMQRRAAKHGRVDVEAPANSASFAEADPSSIRAEDLFLHTFFRTKVVNDSMSGRTKRKLDAREGGDVDGDDDDEEDEEDRFAMKLAESLMRDADPDGDVDDAWASDDGDVDADGDDADEEEVDYSAMDFGEGEAEEEDEDEDEDDDDGFLSAEEDAEDDEEEEHADDAPRSKAAKSKKSHAAEEEDGSDEDEDEDDDDEDAADMPDFLDDLDSDDEQDEEEEAEPASKRAKTLGGKKSGMASGSAFVSADDFEDAMASDNDEEKELRLADQYRAKFGGKKGGKPGKASSSFAPSTKAADSKPGAGGKSGFQKGPGKGPKHGKPARK
jgi:ribosome biogenesis protein MAK21